MAMPPLSVIGLVCAFAAPPIHTVTLDADAFRSDPRLNKPVTLASRAITLADLLGQVSKQTGVSVSIDHVDPASSYTLFVDANGVPAGRLMDNLFSLLSARRSEWAWEKVQLATGPAYTLHETPWAKDRSAGYRRLVDSILNEYLEVMRDMVTMSPKDRLANRGRLKKALHRDDDAETDFFFTSENFWNQARFFFGALSEEQQRLVIAGGTVSISLKSLPYDVYSLFHMDYERRHFQIIGANGSATLVPEPETVTFACTPPSLPSHNIAPTITLIQQSSAQSWMGTGHLQIGLREALEGLWMLPGDSALDETCGTNRVTQTPQSADEKSERQLDGERAATLKAALPAGLTPGLLMHHNETISASLPTCLEQLSSGSGVPVLAILPRGPDRYTSPVGKTAGEVALLLQGRSRLLFCKWRNGALLVNYPEWFVGATSPISQSVLGKFPPDRTGRISLQQWINLQEAISIDQADWLGVRLEFESMRQMRTILLLAADLPSLITDRGLRLDFETLELLRPTGLLPRDMRVPPEGARLRLTPVNAGGGSRNPSALELAFCANGSGKWVPMSRIAVPVYVAGVAKTATN